MFEEELMRYETNNQQTEETLLNDKTDKQTNLFSLINQSNNNGKLIKKGQPNHSYMEEAPHINNDSLLGGTKHEEVKRPEKI